MKDCIRVLLRSYCYEVVEELSEGASLAVGVALTMWVLVLLTVSAAWCAS